MRNILCRILVIMSIFMGTFVLGVWAEEKPLVHFDKRSWEEGYKGSDEVQSLVEYILRGETIYNWTELVTIQSFPGLPKEITPEVFMENIKDALAETCPKIEWNVINKDARSITYEWKVTNCPEQADQHEIVRLILGREKMWAIHYTTKKIPISPRVRQEWIGLLEMVTLSGATQ